MTTCNIASPLVEIAKRWPDLPALIEPHGTKQLPPRRERRLTFRELDAESDRLARGLMAAGISRGMRTVLMVPPSLEFYTLTFALFKIGAVIVLIDPGMGIRNLGLCLGEAEPAAFIGITKAHAARVLLGWGKRTIQIRVTVGPRLFWGGWTLKQIRTQGDSQPASSASTVLAATTTDDLAAILFTSGSTGPAKGAVYTHGIFTAQIQYLREIYQIEPGEMDLPTFPLFGLFGPALGMTAVIPEMDATRPAKVDPRRILNTISHYRITNLFGSPALLRRVGFAREATMLPTLKRVISAGAPVPAKVIEQFTRLLAKGVQVHTPYGATESLPIATIGSDTILGETAALTTQGKGVCVGHPVEGMKVVIIRISDEAIANWEDALLVPAGQIGEIVVQGPVVTSSYFNRPEATALHKIRDGDTVRHRTGDVGYLDEQGRIWFCGRKAHRVTLADRTLFTIPCEGIFNAHPAVHRTALVDGGGIAVLCVELNESVSLDSQQLFAELREMGKRHEITRDIRHFVIHPSFPVDIRHNAKIFREKLAIWAKALHKRGQIREQP